MVKKGSRSKQTIPKDESNSDRFVRVVAPRVTKAVKAIKVIGYCAGATYDFNPQQVKQILNTLSAALTELNNRFMTKAEKEEMFAFHD